jgi:hypothetical protein
LAGGGVAQPGDQKRDGYRSDASRCLKRFPFISPPLRESLALNRLTGRLAPGTDE